MMKIKKAQKKNETNLIHEYSGKHVILEDDEDLLYDDSYLNEKKSTKEFLGGMKESESKLKIAKEERKVLNGKLDLIEEKMNEISKNNLNKKVKKLKTRLR